MSATAYGASKAALNWITKNIHIENPKIIAFPLHPGYVLATFASTSFFLFHRLNATTYLIRLLTCGLITAGFKRTWAMPVLLRMA